jgi:23S rRNA-intervening sequence protein
MVLRAKSVALALPFLRMLRKAVGEIAMPNLPDSYKLAMGSASELDYHLLLARDLKFISMKDYEPLATELSEVRWMLNTFIQKLRANS